MSFCGLDAVKAHSDGDLQAAVLSDFILLVDIETARIFSLNKIMNLKQSYLARNVSVFGVNNCGFKANCFTCYSMVNDIFKGTKEKPLLGGYDFISGMHKQRIKGITAPEG